MRYRDEQLSELAKSLVIKWYPLISGKVPAPPIVVTEPDVPTPEEALLDLFPEPEPKPVKKVSFSDMETIKWFWKRDEPSAECASKRQDFVDIYANAKFSSEEE